MKKIVFLVLFLFIVCLSQSLKAQTEAQRVDLCVTMIGDAVFKSDYPVQLTAAQNNERAPVYRKAIALLKGNRYRFTICTDEESDGEATLQLFDENRMMGRSFDPETGQEYINFDFDCYKTAIYVLFISFKDGKKGSAVGILSHVKTLK